MKLDGNEVIETLCDSLWPEEEIEVQGLSREDIAAKSIVVPGIMHTFAFAPARLEANKTKVKAWLSELQDPFFESKGGGWSFLNACQDKHGQQWGEHRNVEALMAMGIGLKLVSCVPHDMWGVLPGGMPYFTILDKGEAWTSA